MTPLEHELWTALGRRGVRTDLELVHKLAEIAADDAELEKATQAERERRDSRLRRELDAAREIHACARALLASVAKHNRLAYVFHLPSQSDLATVTRLAEDAQRWESAARRAFPPKRPGRKPVPSRQILAEWVGIQLYRRGVPLVTTKSGTWARVVAVLNRHLRYGACPYQRRDLTEALKYLESGADFPAIRRVQNPVPGKRR